MTKEHLARIRAWFHRPQLNAEVIRAAQLQPGDLLVLTASRVLTKEERDALRTAAAELILETGARCIVLEQGLALGVLRSVSHKTPEQGAGGGNHADDKRDEDVVAAPPQEPQGGLERAP